MPADFYAEIPRFQAFDRIADPAIYRPLPDDWVVGLTDVVHSTAAIAQGRYKAVNMAGAAAIAAVSNALAGREFPFAFGGDGAVLAVSGADAARAGEALAATALWVKAELGLDLRVALAPVAALRAAAHDVTVARFAPSPDVTYAMFSGGGVGWLEREVKDRGAFLLPAAPAGARPDLTGLSCRWDETPSARGLVVSLLVLPVEGGDAGAYRDLVARVLALTADPARAGHPLPAGGPRLAWPPKALGMEVGARGGAGPLRPLRHLALMAETLFGYIVLKRGMTLGRFDATRYKHEVVANSDFRKFDDGLRMTLDCEPALADDLEAILKEAAKAGIARYGLHRQKAALVTCIVPSPMQANHMHFVDGATGGYTAAAKAMKAMG